MRTYLLASLAVIATTAAQAEETLKIPDGFVPTDQVNTEHLPTFEKGELSDMGTLVFTGIVGYDPLYYGDAPENAALFEYRYNGEVKLIGQTCPTISALLWLINESENPGDQRQAMHLQAAGEAADCFNAPLIG